MRLSQNPIKTAVVYSEEAKSVFNLDKLLGKHFEAGAEFEAGIQPPGRANDPALLYYCMMSLLGCQLQEILIGASIN